MRKASTLKGARRFKGVIYKIGPNRCVDVPAAISRVFGIGQLVPVWVGIGSLRTQTSLVPRVGGRHRLFLKMELLREAGLDAGDNVSLRVAPDRGSKGPKLPADFALALKQRAGAMEVFCSLRPVLRCRIVEKVELAVRPETRARQIRGLVERLMERFG